MTDKDRMRRLERAQIRVLFHTPFFAPGVAKVENEFTDDPGNPTACTDGKVIRWNRTFFDSLEDQQLVTVLVHEVCHCLLGHLWRFPAGGDPDVWNQATDHAVNLMITEFGATIKAQNLADPFPFPEGKFCCEPCFKGMAEEAIYNVLANRPNSPGQGAGNGVQASGGSSTTGQGGKRPVAGKQQAATGIKSGGQPGHVPFGEFKIQDNSPEASKNKTDWEHTLIQSIETCKGRGDAPGYLKRFLDGLVTPAVPWEELLRNFLREQAADDWNWMRPTPLYSDGGLFMPGLHSEKIASVVFASDWSGSTQGALVEKFHAEKQACLDDLRPSKLLDIGFDTRVVSEREYTVGDKIDPTIQGGGGTSFVDLFRRCEELNPRCVVVLTDLDGEFPKKEPDFPVIWVVYGGLNRAPFGEVINVE